MRTWIILVLALVTNLLWGATAQAQTEADKATARALAIEAQKALEAKDYEQAADKFSRAEELYHAPTLRLGMARAYVGLEKWVEAMESYNAVIREEIPKNASNAFRQAKKDAEKEVEGLDKKIAWVTLKVEGPAEPSVRLDEQDVPVASLGVRRAVNPGDHKLIASGEGYLEGELSFSIGMAEEQDLVLTLQPDPAAGAKPPVDDGATPATGGDDTMMIIGWTAVGVGGAALIVGAVTGGLAMGKRGELTDACDDEGRCPEDQQSTLDSYRTMGTVSTIGFVAGGVLAAAGTVLLILAPSDDVQAEVGFGRVGATIRF